MNKFLIVSTEFNNCLTIQASSSPDKFPFIAIVTYGGRISDKFVGGTEGIEGGPYRVLIPGQLLEDRIKELEGRKVFAEENLEEHSHSVDVGEFLQAWVEPVKDPATGEFMMAAKASGLFYRDKNPELVDKIIALARSGVVGFSYDLKDVQFELQAVSSSEKVVRIGDFKWRGATVLKKEAAAYQLTQLAASKKTTEEEDFDMDEKTLTELVGKGVKEGIEIGIKQMKEEVIQPFNEELKASVEKIAERVDTIESAQTKFAETLEAIGKEEKKAEPKAKEEKTEKKEEKEDEVLSLKDLSASIGSSIKEAITESNKAVIESITDLKDSLKDPNTRKSTGQETDQLTAKGSIAVQKGMSIAQKFVEGYDPDSDEGLTLETIEAAVRTVKATVKDKDTRVGVLAELVAAKRSVARQMRGRGGYVQ